MGRVLLQPDPPFIDYRGTIVKPEPQDLTFGIPGQLVEVLARLDADAFRTSLRVEKQSAEAGRLELARQEAAFEAGGAT